MSPAVEVVLLYGPPFAGKTLYFVRRLSGTHAWVCPKEIFQEDPEATGLRAVILKVLGYLKKGSNVVIDDENTSRITRESYITQIRRKVPQCRFRCIVFKERHPDSRLQYLWAQEWHQARQFCSPVSNPSQGNDAGRSEKLLKDWFEYSEFPDENEGFKINEVQLGLVCDTKHKFELPGLFLDWEGILEKGDVQLARAKEVSEVVLKWTGNNPTGRVIVIHAGKHTCKGAAQLIPGVDVQGKRLVDSHSSCDCLLDLQNTLCKLVEKISTPLYFVFVEKAALSGSFGQLPNPGLLAWLQRLHNIDLTHRATLYICSTGGHFKAASAAGVKSVKAKKVLDSPNMINAIHCGGSSLQMPDIVRNAVLASFDRDTSPRASDVCIPLYDDAITSSKDLGHGRCVTVSRGFGRVHGLCYQDVSALERYQALYRRTATVTQPASSSWLDSTVKQSERQTVDGVKRTAVRDRQTVTAADLTSQSGSVAVSSTDSLDARSPPKIKLLESDEIRAQAFCTKRYDRGVTCVRLVQDLNTATGSEGLWIECKCVGSQGEHYHVSALLGEHGKMDTIGIKKANCTCQDQQAGQLGRCKHVVGMLLKYQENQNKLKHGTTLLEQLKSRTIEDSQYVPSLAVNNPDKALISSSPNPDESRSLPKWMVTSSQGTSCGEKGKRKETGNSLFIGKKRRKKEEKIEKTIYCMVEEELLDTARLILSENDLSHKNLSKKEDQEFQEQGRPNTGGNKVLFSSSPQLESNVAQKEATVGTSKLREAVFVSSSKKLPIRPKLTDSFSGRFIVPESLVSATSIRPKPTDSCVGRAIVPESLVPATSIRPRPTASDSRRAIVPESLVPETVSCVPETVGMVPLCTESVTQLQDREDTEHARQDEGESSLDVGSSSQRLRAKFGKSILDDFI